MHEHQQFTKDRLIREDGTQPSGFKVFGFLFDMKKIPLTQGKFALVDDKDFEKVSRFKWFAVKGKRGTWYAHRNQWNKELKHDRTVRMHRFILNASTGTEIDHEDGNGLNNQRGNLRFCSNAQQRANTRPKKNGSSGVKGVVWHNRDKIYESAIRVNGKLLYLGRSDSLKTAARAYDSAAVKHFGEFARTNKMMGLI